MQISFSESTIGSLRDLTNMQISSAKSAKAELAEQRDPDGQEAGNSDTALEDAILENSNQFHRWHSELEAARVLGTEEKFQNYAVTLRQHLASLDELQNKASSVLVCHFVLPIILNCRSSKSSDQSTEWNVERIPNGLARGHWNHEQHLEAWLLVTLWFSDLVSLNNLVCHSITESGLVTISHRLMTLSNFVLATAIERHIFV